VPSQPHQGTVFCTVRLRSVDLLLKDAAFLFYRMKPRTYNGRNRAANWPITNKLNMFEPLGSPNAECGRER
jgi:hypothetical protein